jgi:hypothetical protein
MIQLEPLPCPICGGTSGLTSRLNVGGTYQAYYVCIGCDDDAEGPVVGASTDEEAYRAAILAWNKWITDPPQV